MLYNIVIIGSGPAGLTAGIYAARARLQPLIIDGPLLGGQLMTTTTVENWPGEKSILGPDLMINMRQQAEDCGCLFMSGSVVRVDFSQRPFVLEIEGGKKLQARAVIVATGAVSKRLKCKGEDEYLGKGVSTCATCDAPFYADKEVVVVGGGNTAVTEVEHLCHVAKKITVVHILDALTATDPIKDKVLTHPKVQFIYSSSVVEIGGNGQHVTQVTVENKNDGTRQIIKADGIFIAIGSTPNTTLFKGQLEVSDWGHLVVHNHTRTNVEGVFAAGDVADYRYKQAITSSSAGCKAALDAQALLAAEEK